MNRTKIEKYEDGINKIHPKSLFLLNCMFSTFHKPGKDSAKKFFFDDEHYTVSITVPDFLRGAERDFRKFIENGSVTEYLEFFGLSPDSFKESFSPNQTSQSVDSNWLSFSDIVSENNSGILIFKVKKGSYADKLMPNLIGNYETNEKRDGTFSSNLSFKNEIVRNCKKLNGYGGVLHTVFSNEIADLVVKEMANQHPTVFMSLKAKKMFLDFPSFVKKRVQEMDMPLSGGSVSCGDLLKDDLSLVNLSGEAYKVSIANLFNVVDYKNHLFRGRSERVDFILNVNAQRKNNWNTQDCVTQIKHWDWDIGHKNTILRNDGIDVYLRHSPTPEDLQKLKGAATDYLLKNYDFILNKIEPKPKELIPDVGVAESSRFFGKFVTAISNFFDSPDARKERDKAEIREFFLDAICEARNPYYSEEKKKDYIDANKGKFVEYARYLFEDDVSSLDGIDKKHLLGPAMENMRNGRSGLRDKDKDFLFSNEFIKRLKREDCPAINPEVLSWFFDGVSTFSEFAEFPDKVKLVFMKKALDSNVISFDSMVSGAAMLYSWKMYDNSAAVELVNNLSSGNKNTVNFVFSVLQDSKKFLTDEEFALAKRSLGFITQPTEDAKKVNMAGLSLAQAVNLEKLPLRGEGFSIDIVLMNAPSILQNTINKYIGEPVKKVGALVDIFNYSVCDDVFNYSGYSYETFTQSDNGLKKEYLCEVKTPVALNLGEDPEKAKEMKVALNQTFNFIVYDLLKLQNKKNEGLEKIEDRAVNFLTAIISQHQIDRAISKRLHSTGEENDNDFLELSKDFKL